MLIDAKLLFSDDQGSITTKNTAHDSTNVLDLGYTSPNIGEGNPLHLVVQVGTETFTGTGGTLVVSLLSCATVGGTYTTHWASGTIALGTLVKGTVLVDMALPLDLLRYVKLTYTTHASNAFTAGKIQAGIVKY